MPKNQDFLFLFPVTVHILTLGKLKRVRFRTKVVSTVSKTEEVLYLTMEV